MVLERPICVTVLFGNTLLAFEYFYNPIKLLRGIPNRGEMILNPITDEQMKAEMQEVLTK